MADPSVVIAMQGRLFAQDPSPPVSAHESQSDDSSESLYSTPDDAPHDSTPSFDDGDGSSESSDASYTSQEFRMGLEYYQQSGHSQSSYPYNSDGTWCLSPAVLDQMDLLRNKHLPESEVDEAINMLQVLIDNDFEANSPKESAIDLAEAMEDGRMNPWGDGFELTSEEKIMIWKAKNPDADLVHLGIPEIGFPEWDSGICGCNLGIGRGIGGDTSACLGITCPLIKDGSSDNQVGRAYELAALRTKCEAMKEMIKERGWGEDFEEWLDEGRETAIGGDGDEQEQVEQVEEEVDEGCEDYFKDFEYSQWYDEITDEWYDYPRIE